MPVGIVGVVLERVTHIAVAKVVKANNYTSAMILDRREGTLDGES